MKAVENFSGRSERAGPALEALPPMQQQFVLALVTLGCTQSKAAELAGYQGGPNTFKSKGWSLAHDPRVQAAILEQSQKLIRAHAPMALNVVVDLAKSVNIDPRVRLKAALELLNRSGLHAHTEHRVTVERPHSDQEQLARVVALAERLGIDPTKLLGSAATPVDVEFSVVSEGDAGSPWTWAPDGR